MKVRLIDGYIFNVERNFEVILIISSNKSHNSFAFSGVKKPKSSEINSCVSTSYAEPIAISKNLAKSLLELLDEPSAIFEGIETDARLN